MIKTFKTFRGNSINSSQYKIVGHNFDTLPSARPVFIEQARADSVDSGQWTVEPRVNFISILITDYNNRQALADQLRIWFKRGSSGPLIATFLDDGLDYQLVERVTNLIPDSENPLLYTAILNSGQTAWRAVTADSDTSWSPSGTGGTHAITPGGTDETRLSLTLTGTAAPTGVYLYQNVMQMPNIPGVAMGYKTFCFTMDTATLVDNEKVQDDCSDLRLFDNGLEINRWIINPNTAATLIYFNLYFSAGQALTLTSGTLQVETATAVHAITGSGNAAVTVTAAGMTGSPKTINVAVVNGNTPAQWANKVRTALKNDVDVKAMFTVSGSGAKIVLVKKSPAADDGTLNIALANGTCTGITAAPTSANTTPGVLYGIASSGAVATLNFVVSAATKASIAALGNLFVVQHGTEWFSCQKTATSNVDCKVNVLSRTVMGSTAQAHSGGDVFYWIEHVLVWFYGNNAVTDPTTAAGYDDTKPVFDLTASDNTKAAWSATSLFYDPAHPSRPGSWSQFISRQGPNSTPYTYQGNATSGNPALGIMAAAYLNGVSWRGDTVTLGWKFSDTECIRRITCTLRKLRTGTAWISGAKLQSSLDGGAHWTDIFSEATPASANVYDTPSYTNVDITDGSTMLRLVLTGVSDSSPNGYALLEALTFIAYWKTANIPTMTLLGEISNYHMSIRVRNSATLGDVTVTDAIELRFPASLNTPLVLDGEGFEATYQSINVHSAMVLDDASRTVWIRLLPGVVNTITIESIDGQSIGTMGTNLSYYRRRI